MATSRIHIRVKVFRPIGSVTTTTVEMDLQNPLKDNPAQDDPDGKPKAVQTDGDVTLVGAYHIKCRRKMVEGKPEPHHLKFWITDDPDNSQPGAKKDDYLLQGIAFSNRIQAKENGKHLGQHVFTNITIGTEPINPADPKSEKVRMLTVINNGSFTGHESYDYLILVQRVSDGAFGIIDPEYENEL